MVYVRGRDEKDGVKDFNDKARRIIADSKEVRRLRSFQKRSIGNPFPPFQTPTGMGFSPEQAVLYAHRQRQTQYTRSEFQNTPFTEEPSLNSNIYNNKKGLSGTPNIRTDQSVGSALGGSIYRGL